MIISPGAKLNLGLSITGKRKDGFHDLVTLFYPIPFSDSLEMVPSAVSRRARDNETDWSIWSRKLAPHQYIPPAVSKVAGLPITYSASGLPVQGDLTNNLCIQAYQLLQADYPELPAIDMHLHKNVPMGAGLGGGSADGAATLKALNQLGHLNLSDAQLMRYAAKLGSDCPVFIKNQPQIATGRGDILTPAPSGVFEVLKGYTLVLVCPMIHVPTATAFSHVIPKAGATPQSLISILLAGPQQWNGQLINDFEVSVFRAFPEIQRIKQDFYQLGAVYAAMTGSGSAVYGLFAHEQMSAAKSVDFILEHFSHFSRYQVKHWLL